MLSSWLNVLKFLKTNRTKKHRWFKWWPKKLTYAWSQNLCTIFLPVCFCSEVIKSSSIDSSTPFLHRCFHCFEFCTLIFIFYLASSNIVSYHGQEANQLPEWRHINTSERNALSYCWALKHAMLNYVRHFHSFKAAKLVFVEKVQCELIAFFQICHCRRAKEEKLQQAIATRRPCHAPL